MPLTDSGGQAGRAACARQAERLLGVRCQEPPFVRPSCPKNTAKRRRACGHLRSTGVGPLFAAVSAAEQSPSSLVSSYAEKGGLSIESAPDRTRTCDLP